MPARVWPEVTLCWTPETGRIRRVSPGWMVEASLMSFAQRMVLIVTLNMSAISERESPFRTWYREMLPEELLAEATEGREPSTLAPAIRAESVIARRRPPLEGFGSGLVAGSRSARALSCSTGRSSSAALVVENGHTASTAIGNAVKTTVTAILATLTARTTQYVLRFS